MSLPPMLKNMNLFNEGQSYLAAVKTVTPPKLARKFEDYRGGGLDGEVPIDMGMDKLEMEWALGGPDRTVLSQFGRAGLTGTYLRFVGAYQSESSGAYTAIEITVRGKHEEIDRGSQEVGKPGEVKVKTRCVYYREEWDGVVQVEIDLLNMVCLIGGVDRLAEQRAAIL